MYVLLTLSLQSRRPRIAFVQRIHLTWKTVRQEKNYEQLKSFEKYKFYGGKIIEIIIIVDVNKGHKPLFKHINRELLYEKKKIRDTCGAE